jgi:hypothetical protein
MKVISLLLISAGLAVTAEPNKAEGVKLSDAEKAQLYKALAAATNAQAAAMQAEATVKSKMQELDDIRKKLETKCGTPLTEKEGQLADCSPPVTAKKEEPKK